MFKKKEKNLKSFIMVVNLQTGAFHLCPYIKTVASITGMNRNDISKITALTTYKHFVITHVKEEV